MTKKFLFSVLGACLLAFGGIAQADPVDLFGYSLNIDGDVYDVIDFYNPVDALPAGVNDTGFDTVSGLGSIVITIADVGPHNILAFFDHEIVEGSNTWFNEFGSANGLLAAGQSWEIDEPGYEDPFGDIYDNFFDGNLSNTNDLLPDPNDVSMAMGWAFSLAAGETATISFLLAEDAPLSGFWLQHVDPMDYAFYFSSTLDITGGPIGVPEPGTLWLLGAGLLGLGLMRHRNLTDS